MGNTNDIKLEISKEDPDCLYPLFKVKGGIGIIFLEFYIPTNNHKIVFERMVNIKKEMIL